jgi:hypothetical protein
VFEGGRHLVLRSAHLAIPTECLGRVAQGPNEVTPEMVGTSETVRGDRLGVPTGANLPCDGETLVQNSDRLIRLLLDDE